MNLFLGIALHHWSSAFGPWDQNNISIVGNLVRNANCQALSQTYCVRNLGEEQPSVFLKHYYHF